MNNKKMTKKELFKELKVLFLGWEILLYTVLLFAGHLGLFYFLTKSMLFSIITGLVGTAYFFFVFVYPNRKLKTHEYHLSELLKYVTNMIFYLRTGSNVLHALKATKNTVDKHIQKDIQKTIEILESKEARLETEHFRKYNFSSLDQFHQNLMIKYERGGDSTELFSHIQKNIIFELKKRDELHKKRKSWATHVYTVLGMVGGMMVILRINAPFLWDIFLEMRAISFTVIAITYLLILINLYLLQKKNLDISVRL
ncbi:hypothetical protein [Siminovitchia fortis]|uniref:hypothetical protein n=1 Tax=Siminovitchia fortis TaxID=254758 RepID=UPI0011A1FE2E|nr:hypothetical protein [Siminovitchia fortis]